MSTIPFYYNAAAATDDKLERMKLVISQFVSAFFDNKAFEKPVESLLGETIQAYGQDGSKIYMEQTNSEPPRSHYLFEGPNGNYTYSGFLEVNVNPGIQSSHLLPNGYRKITFSDGHTIVTNHEHQNIYNLTYGTMGHQLMGKLEFKDEQNMIEAFIELGNERWKE